MAKLRVFIIFLIFYLIIGFTYQFLDRSLGIDLLNSFFQRWSVDKSDAAIYLIGVVTTWPVSFVTFGSIVIGSYLGFYSGLGVSLFFILGILLFILRLSAKVDRALFASSDSITVSTDSSKPLPRYITKGLVALFVIFLLVNAAGTTIIRQKHSGRVLDIVTKKPLEGIPVTYGIEKLWGSHSTNRFVVHQDSTTTDSDGIFSFASYWGFRRPFQGINKYLEVNYTNTTIGCGLNGKERCDDEFRFGNKKYLVEKYDYKNFDIYLSTKEVLLVPIVSDIVECNGNNLCINENESWGRRCFGVMPNDRLYNACQDFISSGGRLVNSDE